ncbi:SdrD B-like domain-containing protein [Psychrobacter sp. Marseille-P5312]|uniref:SdrD B-like domain-containing protein n=1 Tax=Psychrobacter sp. Marseille-P5312 TaxID=2086574 RepID=UPI000CF6C500|nr:SdrD B-like domain-containing protein [Psychrobacter sp. Marseille-P5312]
MTKSLMTPSNRITLHTAKISALTAAMLLMQSNMAFAAPTTLVQTINNIANASYDVNSIKQNSISNQVQVKASALPEYGINLTQQPLRTVAPNTLVNWVNVLSNTSYSDQTIELTLDVAPSLSNLKVYQDLNKNGIVDSGDTQLILDNMSAQIKLGQSENIQFIVQALSDANGKDGDTADIKIGAVVLEDPSVTSVSATDSLVIIESGIKFTTPKFDESKTISQINDDVYVSASYAQCNVQTDKPDQVWVTIKSANPPIGSGDSYSLKAIETGNNTGKYQLSAATQNNANAIDDKLIQTLNSDTLTVSLDACIAPSVGIDADELPNASDFTVRISDLSSQINIVDDNPALVVTKESDVKSAELGDYVSYTIEIKNSGKSTAYDVQLKDALPRGFDYVENSVRVSPTTDIDINQAQTTEFKADGKYQVLNLGNMANGESKKITYRVLVGASSLGGDGINRAIAVANNEQGQSLVSREAQWKIDVERDVMNTDGIIVGKVYHDINRDGIQQKEDGELGVAGVRIYMENGNFIVTDPEGKYNFYGVSAKTHVLKVDSTTIPRETELVTQSNRNAGDAGSRFVDLKYGELHRADFAIVGGMGDSTEHLNAELIARSKSVSAKNDTLEQAVKTALTLEPNYDADTTNNVDASGCNINGDLDLGNNCDSAIVNDMIGDATNRVDMAVTTVAPPVEKELEEYLKEVANNDVSFINLSEGQQLSTYKQMVQVQAPLGSIFTLYANGKAISEQQVGKTAEQEKQNVMAFDYYAVDLKRGSNTLRGVATDINGKTISEQTITVLTPDSLQAIDYRTQAQLVPADGISEYQVVISLKDRDNRPYIGTTSLTLDTNIGRINLKDSSQDQAGTQVTVSGGELLIPVIAPSAPGKGELVIDTGSSKQIIPLQFTAKLRPLIAVGIVEGTISLKDFDGSNITDAQGAFEQELHEISGNDDYSATGRAAMFLKGKVRGDYLLTLAYDSDKKGERLFRDIEPGEYYPVYGDSSAKGFDAQSTSKLYVRVDKGRSFAMYGDLKTQIDNDEGIELGQYNRTLTGLKAQFEDDNTRITAFAAETSTSQRVNETRGLGISGPYPLGEDFDAVLENSETVEVIIRDANNSGLIISRKTLTRFADYEIDPISRSLYLKSPIASLDIDGNPIYLRVTVEVDEGGEKYWVGGVAAKQQLTKKVAIGGSYVNSDDPLNKEELASVNSVIKLNNKLKLVAEYAKNKAENPNYDPSNQINNTELTGNDVEGDAFRVELDYDDKKSTRAKAYYHDADTGFVTGASPLTAGRTESGVEVTHTFNDKNTALKLEGVRTEDHATDASREGVQASVEQRLSKNIVGEVGLRYYKQDATAASRNTQAATDVVDVTDDTLFNDDIINQSALNGVSNADKDIEGTTARARITSRLPKLNNSLVFAEYEQDIENSSRNATSIGGETALGNLGRLYARHDLINSLSGSYGLDDTDERQRTVAGFDATYMKDGKVYSEYRMRDAISAREAEAAIGLKNKWYVQEGLTLSTLFERVESLEGETDNTATAAGIGVEYLAKENYKASGRFEKRWGETSDTLLGSAGIAYRYTDDITLLAKDIYSQVDYDDGHRTINRFQLGAAYRDYDSNQLDMLAKLEYRLDDNATGTDQYQKDTTIWSWSGNYHPTRALTLSGRYAGKYTQYDADDIVSENTAHAAYARGLYDISERWDIGLQAGTYWNEQADDMSYMLGAEVGYSPMTNLWLSLGYNFMGFEDEDIAYDDSTQEGAYFRLRFKFDENLFKREDPRKNKRLLSNATL